MNIPFHFPGVSQIVIFLGAVRTKDGSRRPLTQTIYGALQFLRGVKICELPFLAVIYNPQLYDVGDTDPPAAVGGLFFDPAEDPADSGNVGHFISQYPFFSDSQFTEPPAVLL